MSTSFSTSVRKKTGETCEIAGDYRFDGYTDGSSSPRPTSDEMEIPLQRGETFPPVRSCDKACWRLLARRK
jgi:hypothetical protein